MTWVLETNRVPEWPTICTLCGCDDAAKSVRAYGENFRSLVGPVAVFNVTACAVPCCNGCQRLLRWLTITAVVALVLPWIPITIMALVSWFPPGLGPLGLMVVPGMGAVAGLALLGFRYWYVRAVRIQVFKGGQMRFAIRREDFAQSTATLNDTSTRRTWRPVAW